MGSPISKKRKTESDLGVSQQGCVCPPQGRNSNKNQPIKTGFFGWFLLVFFKGNLKKTTRQNFFSNFVCKSSQSPTIPFWLKPAIWMCPIVSPYHVEVSSFLKQSGSNIQKSEKGSIPSSASTENMFEKKKNVPSPDFCIHVLNDP